MDFAGVHLDRLVIHRVGNKARNEGMSISGQPTNIEDAELREYLLKYFLASIKLDNLCKFFHEADLQLNEVYTYANNSFNNKESFHQQSVNVLKHLYERSGHPNIKSGEFYMAYFTNLPIEDKVVDAIGIFKSENKDVFLTVDQKKNSEFRVDYERGINVKKLDKGCLIINTLEKSGYKVCVVDTTNKGEEAAFWKDEFLKVKEYHDDYFYTKSYLTMCTEFCKTIDEESRYSDKKEEVLFLNDTLKYFTEKTDFKLDDFAKEVLKEPALIDDFTNYKQTFEIVNEIQGADTFEISKPAVKKAKRIIKNLIKLDTEIEIKINKSISSEDGVDVIERGYDAEKKMYFYKVYFNHEE